MLSLSMIINLIIRLLFLIDLYLICFVILIIFFNYLIMLMIIVLLRVDFFITITNE